MNACAARLNKDLESLASLDDDLKSQEREVKERCGERVLAAMLKNDPDRLDIDSIARSCERSLKLLETAQQQLEELEKQREKFQAKLATLEPEVQEESAQVKAAGQEAYNLLKKLTPTTAVGADGPKLTSSYKKINRILSKTDGHLEAMRGMPNTSDYEKRTLKPLIKTAGETKKLCELLLDKLRHYSDEG